MKSATSITSRLVQGRHNFRKKVLKLRKNKMTWTSAGHVCLVQPRQRYSDLGAISLRISMVSSIVQQKTGNKVFRPYQLGASTAVILCHSLKSTATMHLYDINNYNLSALTACIGEDFIGWIYWQDKRHHPRDENRNTKLIYRTAGRLPPITLEHSRNKILAQRAFKWERHLYDISAMTKRVKWGHLQHWGWLPT